MEAGERVGGRQSASNGNAGTFAQYACIPVQRPGLWAEAPGMIVNPRGALRIAPSPHLVRMMPWALGFSPRPNPTACGRPLSRSGASSGSPRTVQGGVGARGDRRRRTHGQVRPERRHAIPRVRRQERVSSSRTACTRGGERAATLRLDASGGPERLRMEAIDRRGCSSWSRVYRSARRGAARGGSRTGGSCETPPRSSTPWGTDSRPTGRDQDGERETEIVIVILIVLVIVIVVVVVVERPEREGDARDLGGVKGKPPALARRVVACDGSTIDAGVVIAAGAHSAGLARQCGDPVPLDTERGYHVQWNEGAGDKSDGAPMLTRPVCTPEGGFIVTPMSGGVRSAGLV